MIERTRAVVLTKNWGRSTYAAMSMTHDGGDEGWT